MVGDKFGATFGTRLKTRLNKSATPLEWRGAAARGPLGGVLVV